MIDFTDCGLEELSVHKIGNKAHDEEMTLSRASVDISDETLQDLLFQYFLSHFSDPEFYHFTFSDGNFELNPLYNYASELFDNPDSFHETSVKIAHHLYEVSNHPNIKSGDLFVARFSDIQIHDEVVQAIGIFKAENHQSFIKINQQDDIYLDYDNGILVDKLDKGCLVFNTGKDSGYKVSVIDKSNKLTEAQYWKELFLHLKPCNDNYHATSEFLKITKNFVKEHIPEEYELGKADQIDMLNRSVDYFKTHETFNQDEFESSVFENEDMAESFRKYDEEYRTNNQVAKNESFEISSEALKKQYKGFKSVLKLDKNFHIYIHGDRSKIEQGEDPDGRKYYKIYYDKER
jgi:hypothetical protein